MPAPAELAKGALRRLAQSRRAPTPVNFAQAYAEEAAAAGMVLPPGASAVAGAAGPPVAAPAPAQGADPAAWPDLVERLVRGLERGSATWTLARRKDSLQRVLAGSGGDPGRLQRRLLPLLNAWDSGAANMPVATREDGPGTGDEPGAPGHAPAVRGTSVQPVGPPAADAVPRPVADAAPRSTAGAAATPWAGALLPLLRALRGALDPDAAHSAALGGELERLARRIADAGPVGPDPALAPAVARAGERAGWLLGHRRELLAEVGHLCGELADGLVELAEEGSWARGQCEALKARLAEGLNARNVRSATDLLGETRRRQATLRRERQAANEALRALIYGLLGELGGLATETERFEANVDRHARAIAAADSLADLGGVVGELLADARRAQGLVRGARERLQADEARAVALERRVQELEHELRRLSDEAATDGLTRLANRRGLERAFHVEAERAQRAAESSPQAPPLAVGLIDIDDFKRLNDSLGHAAGDEALRSLAAHVSERLRAGDTVARFGGEEFVVLLPATPVAEARELLTRLQRSLSASLFLHQGREVFVTFSAGVTAWQPGEALETALSRADEALYEAKRTGKNRTCVA